MNELTNEELADAMDGIHAYDTGCVDSGIRDETLRKRCSEQLHAMTKRKSDGATLDDASVFLAEFIVDRCLGAEALAQGYGPEDAFDFMKWLSDGMNFDL